MVRAVSTAEQVAQSQPSPFDVNDFHSWCRTHPVNDAQLRQKSCKKLAALRLFEGR
jgi:hypothetical protein